MPELFFIISIIFIITVFIDKTKEELFQLEKIRQRYRNKIRCVKDGKEVKNLKKQNHCFQKLQN